MKIEWFKFIPGYGFDYMVSDKGRVLSLNYKRTNKVRILKQILNKNGYLKVKLHVGGKRKWPNVHRLVALAFIPNPNNLPQVNHVNEIKTDNRVENLEWCDAEYNLNYGTRNEKAAATLKNRQDKSKPVNQYTLDGEFVASYTSIAEAERQTGIDNTSITRCCKGKQKYAGTKDGPKYIWRYA